MVGTQYQPSLIALHNPEREAALELFPWVWQAAEYLASNDVELRNASLDDLLASGAPAVSPLVAYMLATRLFDPDMDFRTRIVTVLSSLMQRHEDGTYAAESVRSQVITALSYFDERGLFALLEVGMHRPDTMPDIEKLVKYSPRAGKTLKAVAGDRLKSLDMRRAAIQLLGRIGYVNALSELERLRNRIETRQVGQKSMPFAPPGTSNELGLLSDLQKAIVALQAGS